MRVFAWLPCHAQSAAAWGARAQPPWNELLRANTSESGPGPATFSSLPPSIGADLCSGSDGVCVGRGWGLGPGAEGCCGGCEMTVGAHARVLVTGQNVGWHRIG